VEPRLRMLDDDAASAALGIRLIEAGAGRAVLELTVRADHLNGFGITHGGIVFALADTAFAVACNEDERVTVAAGADISFLRSTHAGDVLTATATRRARSGRSGLYDVTVVDGAGEVVAEFRGRSVSTDRPRAR
jgi:acyl-CoA thioesterase